MKTYWIGEVGLGYSTSYQANVKSLLAAKETAMRNQVYAGTTLRIFADEDLNKILATKYAACAWEKC